MKRSFQAPEYLQISLMDCGVGALATFLRGYGLEANYERLRDACQTSVDGTSIEAIEELAGQLGVDAVQHLLPPDLLLDGLTGRWPAIVVVNAPGQPTHFVTLWRRLGSWIHFMDPARGGAWRRRDAFERLIYTTTITFDEDTWRDWWLESSFREALRDRATSLLPTGEAAAICSFLDAPDSLDRLAAIDASLRLVARAQRATANVSASFRAQLFRATLAEAERDPDSLPSPLWSLRATEAGLEVTAGVALAAAERGWEPAKRGRTHLAEAPDEGVAGAVLRREGEVRWNVWRDLWKMLSLEARWIIGICTGVSVVFALAAAAEVLLFRAAAWDGARMFPVVWSRMGVAGFAITLFIILGALEGLLAFASRFVGRELEVRLREVTFSLLPRVDDDFVRSRPTADLAYRAHSVELGREFPNLVLAVWRSVLDVVVTAAALTLVRPSNLLVVLVGAAVLAGLTWAGRTRLQEVDTRFQAHGARLLNLFLDSLRGFRPVRLHGYQAAFRREQDHELGLWRQTGLLQGRTLAGIQSFQSMLTTLWIGALFWNHIANSGEPRTFIVVAFWSLRLPSAIETIVTQSQEYVPIRSAFTRLLEITRYSREDVAAPPPVDDDVTASVSARTSRRGVSVELRNASVVIGGHPLVRSVSLYIPGGQHVAVVGASGSGKSTLVSMMLGFQTIAAGSVAIDGQELTPEVVAAVRAHTAWIDPAVQIWNGTFMENLEYAASGYARRDFLTTLEVSDLLRVLDGMDRGLDTMVGAEGRLLSGGEGQRLRLGRALLRGNVRLAILDEAFRGLEREARERLAVHTREALLNATMLFVSHDVSHALRFDRVLVMDGGVLVEDGNPAELAGMDSRFRAMLDAEKTLLGETWANRHWRRIRVERGKLAETGRA